VYLYSALFVVPHTQGAQAWITQCYLQLHQYLPSYYGRRIGNRNQAFEWYHFE